MIKKDPISFDFMIDSDFQKKKKYYFRLLHYIPVPTCRCYVWDNYMTHFDRGILTVNFDKATLPFKINM